MKFAFVLASLAKGMESGDGPGGFLPMEQSKAADSEVLESEELSFSITFWALNGEVIGDVVSASGENALSNFESELGLENTFGYSYSLFGTEQILSGAKPLRVLYEERVVTNNTLSVLATANSFEGAALSDPFLAWSRLATLSEEDPKNPITMGLQLLVLDDGHYTLPHYTESLPDYNEMQERAAVFPANATGRTRFYTSNVWRFRREEFEATPPFMFLGIDVPAYVTEISLEPIKPRVNEDDDGLSFILKFNGRVQYGDDDQINDVFRGGNDVFRGGEAMWDQEMARLYEAGNFRRTPEDPIFYCLHQALSKLKELKKVTAASDAEVMEAYRKIAEDMDVSTDMAVVQFEEEEGQA